MNSRVGVTLSELIHQFGIDWKLLLAQTINFFVLLLLLKKFAYKPVLEMLKKRKERIEDGLKFSKEAEQRLERIEKEREKTLTKTKAEAFAIVSQAEEAAQKRKDEITLEANKKVEDVVAGAKKLIGEEKAKIGEKVLLEAEGLIRLGIEKVLGKMPAEKRDELLIQEAIKELKSFR